MFWKLQENVLNEEDIEVLVDFIRHTKRFTQFEKVKEFEQEYSRWLGTKYCVYVNSGILDAKNSCVRLFFFRNC